MKPSQEDQWDKLQETAPGMEIPFSLAEYRARLDRIRGLMERDGIDLLYLSAPESMYYVSGYQAEWYQAQSPPEWPPTSGIAVHVDHDRFILFDIPDELILNQYMTISRDTRIYQEDGAELSIVDGRGMVDWIAAELKAEGWTGGTAGLEMYSYRPNRIVSERFQAALETAGCRVVDATHILQEARRFKSPQELAYTEKAARIADVGLQAAIDCIQPGITELDVYGEIIYAMSAAGGENPAIPVMVVAGARSGHALASRRQIMVGDLVNIDLCGVFNRYHSDVSRTVSIGEPALEVAEVVAKSARAFDVLRETVRPNLPVAELTGRMQQYYEEAGIWDDNWWVGGYELGIGFPPDWVGTFLYDPLLDPGDAVFPPGLVVNYESIFMLPEGAGHSALIDTVAFSKERARVLSQIPADLIVVD